MTHSNNNILYFNLTNIIILKINESSVDEKITLYFIENKLNSINKIESIEFESLKQINDCLILINLRKNYIINTSIGNQKLMMKNVSIKSINNGKLSFALNKIKMIEINILLLKEFKLESNLSSSILLKENEINFNADNKFVIDTSIPYLTNQNEFDLNEHEFVKIIGKVMNINQDKSRLDLYCLKCSNRTHHEIIEQSSLTKYKLEYDFEINDWLCQSCNCYINSNDDNQAISQINAIIDIHIQVVLNCVGITRLVKVNLTNETITRMMPSLLKNIKVKHFKLQTESIFDEVYSKVFFYFVQFII